MTIQTDSLLTQDSYFISQKHMAVGKTKYQVTDESGHPLCYVERPALRLFGRRGHVTVYADEQSREPLLVLEQEERYEFFNRNYNLVDKRHEEVVARLLRNNFRSLFRRSWQIYDSNGTFVALAREDSPFMSFVRRIVDFIPYVDILGPLLRTNFDLYLVGLDMALEHVGRYDRKVGLRDKYILDLSADPARRFDRRIALGLGILLDTAEAR
jgi:hypothetical protein